MILYYFFSYFQSVKIIHKKEFALEQFESLLNTYKKQYKLYIDRISFDNIDLKQIFLDLLNEDDYKRRKNIWENKIVNSNKFSNELYKLSNPYFVGFGNPKSEILFIGKEKGFDIQKNPELLFEESINNIYHWQHILSNDHDGQSIKFQKLFDFSPLFPLSYPYKHKFRKSNTWFIYSKILAATFGKLSEYNNYFNKHNYDSSLFAKCFMTEFNYVPSRYSKKLGQGIDERFAFLRHKFYSKFKVIIIGARTYFDDKKYQRDGEKSIENVFNVEYDKDILSPRMKTKLFRSDEKILILTSQLSGGAGWRDAELTELGGYISNFIS